MVLSVFSHWMYKKNYSYYQDSSVIYGSFVYCIFGWEMHRLSKSLEIWYRMASFWKISLLTYPCLIGNRAENLKSQAILALLDGLQELHLDWQAWVIIVDIFWPQIQRKRSEEYLVVVLSV